MKWEKTIYFLGSSQMYGAYNEDSHTIASFAQKKLNIKSPNTYRVINIGTDSMRHYNHYLHVSMLNMQEGDIVVETVSEAIKDIISIPYMEQQIECLREIQKICHKKKAKYLIVSLPYLGTVNSLSNREKKLMERAGITPELNRKIIEFIDMFQKKLKCHDLPHVSLHNAADKPNAFGETFLDFYHYTYKLNAILADKICDYILNHGTFQSNMPGGTTDFALSDEVRFSAVNMLKEHVIDQYSKDPTIIEWLERIKRHNFDTTKKISSIVMNCNPFTKGHQFLISKSLECIDYLYIFIVEENMSTYSFTDRYAMAELGTSHFGDRVSVIPSGRFIISSFCFPDYFSKETRVTPADSTIDVLLFGAIIAPHLTIKHRFVGEEPTCAVTNSYNNTLQYFLPVLGVELHVLPRIKHEEQPISASTVRKLFAMEDFDGARSLLPETTFTYLKSNNLNSQKSAK